LLVDLGGLISKAEMLGGGFNEVRQLFDSHAQPMLLSQDLDEDEDQEETMPDHALLPSYLCTAVPKMTASKPRVSYRCTDTPAQENCPIVYDIMELQECAT
jgi:hypothetical protein